MLEERTTSGDSEFWLTGGRAHREFLAEWDEAFYLAPKPGEPHPDFPLLRVSRVRFEPQGVPYQSAWGNRHTHRQIFVDYDFDYRNVPLGEEPRITHSGTVQVLNTCAGRERDDTGAKISIEDMTAATLYTAVEILIDCAVPDDPSSVVMPLLGHINNAEYQGFAIGTLLFLNYDTIHQYDYASEQWYYRLTYKLLYRGWIDGAERTHNEMYFAPEYDRDVDGNIRYYQNKDSGAPDYTTDAALASTPVYKSGADEGAWSTTTPKSYEEADFSGLPLQ